MFLTFLESVQKVTLADPGTLATGVYAYQDMAEFTEAEVALLVGATDQAIDLKLVQAQDDSGTGKKDVEGAAITQLTGADDNKLVTIEIDQYQLDGDNGYRYVTAELTLTGGAATTGAVLFQGQVRHQPASQPASVAEQVLVTG